MAELIPAGAWNAVSAYKMERFVVDLAVTILAGVIGVVGVIDVIDVMGIRIIGRNRDHRAY